MRAHPGCRPSTEVAREAARRRTFAIISHPDAGKTTLTEKLLLYAGAGDLAGAVRSRKGGRHARSDWMAIERQRGISITSTALHFDYDGCRFNLLDTPGHQDFSEDTYRTLIAVDSAVMVLDAAKGIEPQTRKLFEVCRRRGIPIVTFVNKLDHPGREPLALVDELEQVLGIGAVPRNWPIGQGPAFQGVYDLEDGRVLQFERTEHGRQRAMARVGTFDDPILARTLGELAYRQLREDVELLAVAGARFDPARFLCGAVTPVYFGSALNNFGVEPFLRALTALAPPPGPRMSSRGLIAPERDEFSGFVFKIQANMDPLHRDRMAFVRICSGRFEKAMLVHHPRLSRTVRLARPHRLFAGDRETVDEAFPGDVVGLVNPGLFAIGDTLCAGEPFRFDAIPRFQPECFAVLHTRGLDRYKQFHKGLAQLEEEGAMQTFVVEDGQRREPILAAVGELQFDVVRARLATEYGVETTLERLALTSARWLEGEPDVVAAMRRPSRSTVRAHDREGLPVVLFASEWERGQCEKENPGIEFRTLE